jgi:hypothetical protein
MPKAVTAEAWRGHVDEMMERAHLDADEAELVTRYLMTMASSSGSR